ncbi:MAG: glycosyltransferase [Betaproteobacteria bacterium]|nr:glycosyltransferase [Betaproteobacteria bacterium]
MKITVITVCYNAAATIADALRSVASQDHSDVEHIVVDGGSKDGTLAILERNKASIKRMVSAPDKGIYDAMNKGLAMATGEVVGFLNADDWYAHPGVLSRVSAQFAWPEVDACYADLVYVDKDNPEHIIRYWTSRAYRNGLCEQGWMPAHPTFYVRREIYRRHGGFDIRYRLQADFEICMRFLAVKHVRAVYVPEIWVRMRMGGATNRSIRNVWRGNLEAYRAARESGLRVSPLFILQKLLSRVPQFFARPK